MTRYRMDDRFKRKPDLLTETILTKRMSSSFSPWCPPSEAHACQAERRTDDREAWRKPTESLRLVGSSLGRLDIGRRLLPAGPVNRASGGTWPRR